MKWILRRGRNRFAIVELVAFNPKLPQLALVSQGAATVCDLQTGKILWQHTLSGYGPWLEWHPDGKTLAVGESLTGGDVISLWDVAGGKQIGKLEGMQGEGLRCAFNHAGTLLASTGWGRILRLWDPLTSRQLFGTFDSGGITPRFSPDDRFLAGAVQENELRIWEIAAGDEYRTLTANLGNGNRLYGCSAVSADGRLLAAGAHGGVGLWDLPSGKNLAFIEGSPGHNYVLLEPSEALLTMGQNGLFRRTIHRDKATGVVHVGAPKKLPVPGVPNMIAQSGDGQVLASPQFDGAVVWNPKQPDRPIKFGPHADARGVAVSPDGQWVVTGGFSSGGAKVWEARTGRPVKDLPVGGQCWVVFSPDGKRLLTRAGAARQIRAWEVGTWAEVPFKEPLKGMAPAFSPDGKLLVVETGAGVARLLDPKTRSEYARLEDPNQDRARHFTFSPDSTKLVCAAQDGHCLHTWDLRAMRLRLAKMGLDWDSPAYPPLIKDEDAKPLTVEVDLVSWAAKTAAYVDLRQWDKAAAAQNEAVEFEPGNPMIWFESAYLRLQAGDAQGYRTLCARMLARFGQSKDMFEAALLAHTCALAPRALGDVVRVRQLAEQRLALTRTAPVHHTWSVHVLGLAYYRTGDPDRAVACLEKGLKDHADWGYSFLNELVLAMAHHKLTHTAEARRWLDKARQRIAQVNRNRPEKDGGFAPPGWAWRDWLGVEMLQREAQNLIK
jgi:WD40 repeat protein